MSTTEAPAKTPPTAYIGTILVNIRGRDYAVHSSPPPMGATLEDLEKALAHNRTIIKQSQDRMQRAFIDQNYHYKPASAVDYDSPTQDAIMAHLNINILIPLINVRGGNAGFEKADTFPVQQRVELMRASAERQAHMTQTPEQAPLPTALLTALILFMVMVALMIT